MTADQLYDILATALSARKRHGPVYSLPTVLMDQRDTHPAEGARPRMETLVGGWFIRNGLHVERGTPTVSIGGYADLLRSLINHPPWERVEMADTEGPLSAERAHALRPLSEWCSELGEEGVIARYDEYLDATSRIRAELLGHADDEPPFLRTMLLELLRRKLALIQAVGVDQCQRLNDAVFDFDDETGYPELTPRPGAPDLLVWHPEASMDLWFFAEVKGPQDHLRATQMDWIREFVGASGWPVRCCSCATLIALKHYRVDVQALRLTAGSTKFTTSRNTFNPRTGRRARFHPCT